MQNALETSFEISKLVKKSPKQLINIHTLFTENDEWNKTKIIRIFSDTRWTVRCGTLVSNSALQGIERIMEVVLKRVQGHGNQCLHNGC